ncbi:MAG TPA: hypothetical protein VES65_07425 [Solirubrobacteraceae bacterium]|nr:hypothetical protein [Solirubrobacteraceae bacterium]
MGTDLLSTIRAEIDARLSELRPLLAEYEELASVAEALAAQGSGAATTTTVRAPAAVRSPAAARAHAAGRRGPAARARTHAPSARALRKAGARSATAARGRGRAPRGAAGEAVLAALEHGSHTVAELAVVTAMSDASLRADIRRMLRAGTIVKIGREGKAAYALPPAAGA